MSEKYTDEEFAQLAQVNTNLRASLSRCRALLSECRSKLAANSNEPELAHDGDDSDVDERADDRPS